MQVEKPKIELYQNRSFGQKLSATFDFLRENYKLWLKACFYLILPLCLVQAFSFETMFSTLMPFYTDALEGWVALLLQKAYLFAWDFLILDTLYVSLSVRFCCHLFVMQ